MAKFKMFKNADGGTHMRRVIYVVAGDSLGLEFYYDTEEEAQATCRSNNYVYEAYYDEVIGEPD